MPYGLQMFMNISSSTVLGGWYSWLSATFCGSLPAAAQTLQAALPEDA
jgi:hypothetical protein